MSAFLGPVHDFGDYVVLRLASLTQCWKDSDCDTTGSSVKQQEIKDKELEAVFARLQLGLRSLESLLA